VELSLRPQFLCGVASNLISRSRRKSTSVISFLVIFPKIGSVSKLLLSPKYVPEMVVFGDQWWSTDSNLDWMGQSQLAAYSAKLRGAGLFGKGNPRIKDGRTLGVGLVEYYPYKKIFFYRLILVLILPTTWYRERALSVLLVRRKQKREIDILREYERCWIKFWTLVGNFWLAMRPKRPMENCDNYCPTITPYRKDQMPRIEYNTLGPTKGPYSRHLPLSKSCFSARL